ncbi:hypothetical protein PR048_005673 [Dryococelus australis]|uniref:RNA-directed DNA polymerase n=1 Tax=Dryococelus australis TaxID=614101 RepID=A0ABQ9I8W4_9NEOP|nr:hypothetical protein PR048_005673 [Dryococelus australis]
MKQYHKSSIDGHQGAKRTLERLRSYCQWPNMREDIERYTKTCDSCQQNKLTQRKCSVDIVVPMPETEGGNRYMLTCQDALSKFTVAKPIPSQDEETVTKTFVEEIVLRYKIQHSIVTDQGSNFMSEMMKFTCKLLRGKN